MLCFGFTEPIPAESSEAPDGASLMSGMILDEEGGPILSEEGSGLEGEE